MFLSVLAIFQIKQCLCLIIHFFWVFSPQVLQCEFLIFYVFHCFLPYSRNLVCVSHFAHLDFSVSRHISHSNVCVSHFPLFSVFLPYSMFYILQFSFSKFLSFSCHIVSPTVCVCVSFSTLFRVSHHIPAPIVWVSHFFRFPCFSLYSRSYNVHFSFFTLFQVFSPYFTS